MIADTTAEAGPAPLRLGARVRRGRGYPTYTWFIENVAGHSVFLRLSRNRLSARSDGYLFFSTPWVPRSDPARFDTEWVEFMSWETMWLWQMDYGAASEPQEMTTRVLVLDEGQEREVTLRWESSESGGSRQTV